MPKWTVADAPDQSGRTVVITGANSGLGLESALALAGKGARVLLACRNQESGRSAVETVRKRTGNDQLELIELDLTSLASIAKAAGQIRERTGDKLQLLLNNAGIMAAGEGRTADGFELHIGINHIGHAALTWQLLPALLAGGNARVVTVSSMAHKIHDTVFDVDDLHFDKRPYHPGHAYNGSKLANLLFAFELDRRLRAAGADVISIAAHPGLSSTHLATNMKKNNAPTTFAVVSRVLFSVLGQSPKAGAKPQLYAATMPEVQGGEYYGPDKFNSMRGNPTLMRASSTAYDEELAARLWDATTTLAKLQPQVSATVR